MLYVHINNIKMLHYDRIDVSEGIDVYKTSASKACVICRYWYFLDKRFRFQLYVCNGCHDASTMSMKSKDTIISNICSVDYHCIKNGISKMKPKIYCKMLLCMKNIDHYKI